MTTSAGYMCKVCGNNVGDEGCMWVTRSHRQDEAHRSARTNQRVIPSDAARAVGRFRPNGPEGYRSSLGGPLRSTRAEAVADYVAHHAEGDRG